MPKWENFRAQHEITLFIGKATTKTAKTPILGKAARLRAVPKIALPRGRTHLVDTNGKAARRIAKSSIFGKAARLPVVSDIAPPLDQATFVAAQHPKQGARSGATGNRSIECSVVASATTKHKAHIFTRGGMRRGYTILKQS